MIFMQRLMALIIQLRYHPAPSTPKKVNNPHVDLPGFFCVIQGCYCCPAQAEFKPLMHKAL